MRTTVSLLAAALILMLNASVYATSAQIESSEPVLSDGPGLVHATAFFGAVPGSDLYDTAGSLGATFQLGKQKSGRFYFFGDIFTWIDNADGGSFNPKRVIYTLEPGYAIEDSRGRTRLFIKHQSFHDVDFDDDIDESYELYGASYQWLTEPNLYLSVGNYLNKDDVDYEWDFAAAATWDVGPLWGRDTYFHVWLHHVTESDTDRNGFTDYAGELGVKASPVVTLFARYETLHDIDRFGGETDSHTMLGARYTW